MRREFNLSRIASRRRRVKIRRRVRFQPIRPTAALEAELVAILRKVPRAWRESIDTRILPAFEVVTRPRPAVPRFFDTDRTMLEAAIAQSVAAVRLVVDRAAAELAAFVKRLEAWHRRRWRDIVERALDVDLDPLMAGEDVEKETSAFTAVLAALAASIADDLRKDVERLVWNAVVDETPRPALATAIGERLDVGDGRAKTIGGDQIFRVTGALDMLRQVQAGVDRYVWHTQLDERVRESHAEREGGVYSWASDDIVPGEEINCRCWAEPYLEAT